MHESVCVCMDPCMSVCMQHACIYECMHVYNVYTPMAR